MGYFLVARNRKNNSFQVLSLKETWYLGSRRGHENVWTRENDLEAIDLVTTRFTSEDEMAARMVANGYIPNSNVDIFIATKRKKDGQSYIKIYEPIYNMGENRRVTSLRRIARTSLSGDFREAQVDLDEVYDEVIARTYFADDFYVMLRDGDTNISSSFCEQLKDIQLSEDIPYDLKSKPGFGAQDYNTVRNIVEALNRLECLSISPREDRAYQNAELIEKKAKGRIPIIPELSIQLDENYIEGQLSLFSSLEEQEEKKEKMGDEKQGKTLEKIVISRKGVTESDKKKAIFKVLRSIPRNTFYKEKDGTFCVNYDVFKHPLLDEEKKKLDTYLTGKLPNYFAIYINNYRNFCEANERGTTPGSELSEMQRDLEYDARKINNRFKSSKCLNMAYEWCMLYDGCRKREAAYEASGITVDSTDSKAKVYGKKPE